MENQAEINSQAIFEYVKKLEKENQDLKSLVMDLHEYIQDLKEESEYYQWKCKKKRTLSFEEFKEKSPICQKQDANFTDHDNFQNFDFENNTKSNGKHSETDSQTSDITLKSTSRDK